MWFTVVCYFGQILWALINVLTSSRTESSIGRGTYSINEQSVLTEFRAMVSDVLEKEYEFSDQFLDRWLRASHFDLNAANDMFRKAQEWRRDYKMDSILNEIPLATGDKDLCGIKGIAYDGSPVIFVRIGEHDIRGYMVRGLKSNLTRLMYQCLERIDFKLRDLTQKTGIYIGKATGIVDAGGFNLRQHACIECLSHYREFIRDIPNFYPEFSKLIVMLNTPRILKPFLEIAIPLIPSSIIKTIRVFGSDRNEWSTFLLKHIPADQLSPHFGGTAPW